MASWGGREVEEEEEEDADVAVEEDEVMVVDVREENMDGMVFAKSGW